jgi:hypothetical protein
MEELELQTFKKNKLCGLSPQANYTLPTDQTFYVFLLYAKIVLWLPCMHDFP